MLVEFSISTKNVRKCQSFKREVHSLQGYFDKRKVTPNSQMKTSHLSFKQSLSCLFTSQRKRCDTNAFANQTRFQSLSFHFKTQ